MSRRRTLLAAALGAALTLVLAACGGSAGDGGSGPVVLGTTLPLTGGLGVFGPVIRAGYEQAVADINKAGGVDVGGTSRQLKLVVKDNKSDPTEVTSTARSLINDDNAAALLGSVTPPLTIPFSVVAEQERVPALSSLTPTRAWLAASPRGWRYAYDVFTDEAEQTAVNFKATDQVRTNKRVALFTDTEEDGKAMGALWERQAAKHGYTIAYHAQFPVGTTDFSQFVQNARDAHADVMIAQVTPPDAAALWKQMKALHYAPVTAWPEKGGSVGFPQAVGPLAEGASVFGYWTPTNGNVGGKALYDSAKAKFGDGTATDGYLASYAMVQIMADAISRAGSTDPDAINKALAQTKGLGTVLARITIGSDHRAVIPVSAVQWQGDRQVTVWPPDQATGKFEAPAPGLAR
ncbi:ABC transporter substrate-binding protein [Streptomyces sp. NPDC050743]|uniref:ABC transporter substrate-binding protein n=1 Tax=Streptomyces sp. NPDC050743 TaxID=3365634 RepID=UPI0037925186